MPLEVHVETTAMAAEVIATALAVHKRRETLRRNSGTAAAAAAAAGAAAAEATAAAAAAATAASSSTVVASPSSPSSKMEWDKPELYCLMIHDEDGLPDDLPVPTDRPVSELGESELVLVSKAFNRGGGGGAVFGVTTAIEVVPMEGRISSAGKNMDDLTDNFPDSSDEEYDGGGEAKHGGDGLRRVFSTISISEMARSSGVGLGGRPPSFAEQQKGNSSSDDQQGQAAAAAVLTVSLPDGSDCKVLPQAWWTASDLITDVAVRRGFHGLAVLSRAFELHVLWIDQERLRWPDTAVSPAENVAALAVAELELRAKTFLDEPHLVPFGGKANLSATVAKARMLLIDPVVPAMQQTTRGPASEI